MQVGSEGNSHHIIIACILFKSLRARCVVGGLLSESRQASAVFYALNRCEPGYFWDGRQRTLRRTTDRFTDPTRPTGLRRWQPQIPALQALRARTYSSGQSRTGPWRERVGAYCDPHSARVPIKCNTAALNEVSSEYSTCRRRPLRSDRTTMPSCSSSRKCRVSIFFEAPGNILRS
jgi:hypothetical protein